MEALQLKDQHFSKEAYFEKLIQSDEKLEYVNGKIIMMAGGSINHSEIVDNTFFALRANRGDCKVRSSELAISVKSRNSYHFPDVSAVCGEDLKYEEQKGVARITNPCLIVEVLSDATADYDLGDKFRSYRELDSFREYMVIDSRKLAIDTYYRESSDLWHIRSYYKLDQEVEVRTLGVSIPVSVFYDGIDFS